MNELNQIRMAKIKKFCEKYRYYRWVPWTLVSILLTYIFTYLVSHGENHGWFMATNVFFEACIAIACYCRAFVVAIDDSYASKRNRY